MRIVEKLLYMICGVLALVLLFIAFCNKNPEIAKQIGEMLSLGGVNANTDILTNGNINAMPALGSEAVRIIVTKGEPPAAQAQTQALENEKEESLNIPSKVAKLTGYIPVKPSGAAVTQAKADEILSTLGKGETGDGLSFDEEFYPYYAMLNDTQKALYRQIYANADAMIKNFAPVEKIQAPDLKNAFSAVVNDHPELFWVETAYKYKYAPNGQAADITLVFNVTANDIETAKSEFAAAVKTIMDETYGHYTDYEKEKIAHDTLIGKVKYDANAPMNQSAYSALIYGRTVCAGYARAFQYILQQLKIPCYYVTGYAGENHAWNIVKLDDGQYYNVDSTWDDTNPNTYDYFNCSDADYAGTHVRKDLSVYLPPCSGSRYSGLEVNPPAASESAASAAPQKPQTGTAAQAAAPAQDAGSLQTPGSAAAGNNTADITVQTVRGSKEGYIGKIEDYYLTCFEAMMASDYDNISFDIAVYDKNLWKEIYNAYNNGSSQEGYIERYLVEKHKDSCTMSVTAWEQSDGSWMLRHEARVK